MKTKLILVLLVSLLSFSIEAKPKKAKKLIVQSFEELTYTQDPFTVIRNSMDEAFISAGEISDGSQAPLPFYVFRGQLTDHEFRETLIFITDNLSEAYNH